jgi:Tfp pilus assembly protein PilF
VAEQQRQAQANTERYNRLLTMARQQFHSRQYRTALSSIDEALKIDPGDATAQQLRKQIVQTIENAFRLVC